MKFIMKALKIVSMLTAIGLCFTMFFINTSAVSLDKNGSITLHVSDLEEKTPLEGTRFRLYYFAAAYKNDKPIVYYGSSITQGGCASRPGNCYQAIISAWNNVDYVNLGFSGNAKAEDELIRKYPSNQTVNIFQNFLSA